MNIVQRFKELHRYMKGSASGLAPPPTDELDLTYQAENATERWYAHRLDAYEPDLGLFGFKADEPCSHDKQIADRLIRYFHHLEQTSSAQGITFGLDMWANITKGHASLQQALLKADGELVSAILHEVATGTLVSGFMNVQPYARLRARAAARRIEAKWFVDKLLSLSEALGCFAIQGVEQGKYGFDDIDLAERLAVVQARLPFDIAPPKAGGGSFGLKSGPDIFNVKDLYAIYTASRVCQFTQKEKAPHVAEIGGGTGTLGYYLVMAGIPKVSIYDLPTVSVIQAYYLMRSLGSERVWLYGEADSHAGARVLPFWALDSEPENSISLFVNQDSLPEIDREVAFGYMELIKKKGSALFSINQEGRADDGLGNHQSVVFELVEAAGGLTRIHRHLHWMRVGYVEELYCVTD